MEITIPIIDLDVVISTFAMVFVSCRCILNQHNKYYKSELYYTIGRWLKWNVNDPPQIFKINLANINDYKFILQPCHVFWSFKHKTPLLIEWCFRLSKVWTMSFTWFFYIQYVFISFNKSFQFSCFTSPTFWIIVFHII